MKLHICPYVLSGECNCLNDTCDHSIPHKVNANCIVPLHHPQNQICPDCVETIFESEFIEEKEMSL